MLSINDRNGIFITNGTGRVGRATLETLCQLKNNFNSPPETIYIEINNDDDKLKMEQQFQKIPFLKFVKMNYTKSLNDIYSEELELFKKIKTIFIIPSTHNDKVIETNTIIDLVEFFAIPNVLLFSILNPTKIADKMRKQYYFFEEKLKSTSLNYKILRAGFFMENINYYKNEILYQNNFSLPIGNGVMAPISIKDIGVVASKILLHFNLYSRQIYNITGNRLYTGQEIASLLSNYLNRNITFKPCDHLMDTPEMKEGHITNIMDMPITSESTLHNAWLNENGMNARCPCHKPKEGKNEVVSVLELCQSIAQHNFNQISTDLQQDFGWQGMDLNQFLENLCQN